MKTQNIILLGIVGYVAYRYFTRDERTESGEFSNAAGSAPCFCNGEFLGYVNNKRDCRRLCKNKVKYNYASGGDTQPCICQGVHIGNMTERQCKRKCRNAININVQK